jgi:hypothetical protein
MNQILAAAVAFTAIAGATIFEGIRFEFWSNSDPEMLNVFEERLKSVPESFGDWTSEPAAVDETQIAAANIRAHVSRNYTDQKTGRKVNVFLVCGKTHPMAIHSPDQCYAAAGFKQGDANRKYIPVDVRTAERWVSRFTPTEGFDQPGVSVYWSWAADDGFWQAPSNPRPHFSNKDALYKLYVITAPGEEAVADQFLADFLPVLDKLLFKPAATASQEAAETTS